MSASTRTTRRQATKRTVLGAIDDNDDPNDAGAAAARTKHASSSAGTGTGTATGSTVTLPTADLDGTSTDQIRLLIQDLEREVQTRTDAIALKAEEAISEQREVAFLGGIKLGKDLKKMTVGDFNAKFGCDVLADVMKAISLAESGGAAGAGKKRVRPVGGAAGTDAGGMALETPAVKKGGVSATPGMTRTVRRGEAVFSVNGSPVDHAEEGDLVATVAKKRRGNSKGNDGSSGSESGGDSTIAAAFDINVGDGRYISLSDPTTVEHLDDDMKSTAMNQLKILQDQMASLMAQLGN